MAVVDILDGASYLFGYGTGEGSPKWKARKDVDELADATKRMLGMEEESKTPIPEEEYGELLSFISSISGTK